MTSHGLSPVKTPRILIALGEPRFSDESLRHLSLRNGAAAAWQALLSRQSADSALAAVQGSFAIAWEGPGGSAQVAVDRFAIQSFCYWVIAAQLWIVSQGRAAIYKVAYDEQYKNLSPGTVLTAQLMQHVMDIDGVAEVDYLIGEDPYKRKWMTHHRERIGLVAFDCRTASGLFLALRMRLGQLLRSSRWFKKLVKPQHDMAAITTASEATR